MGTIGIEWVNQYHGRAADLSNNDDNARGFYLTLSGTRRFEWGDDLAWDRDFEEKGRPALSAGTDDIWADDVDIVFFSGHGSTSGILFGVADKDNGQAKPSEMRLGDRQLEWIVFDACEVLRHSANASVFDRWRDTFAGLHIMLGFHTTCLDVSDRGKRFAKYLNAGETVISAWGKAATETESSSTWYACLWADETGLPTNTQNDHWHGEGYVSPDPDHPNRFTHLRATC